MIETIRLFFVENEATLAQRAASLDPGQPTYAGLDWRLDVQIASRWRGRHTAQPIYLLQLHTCTDGQQCTHALQAEASSLRYVADELEAALQAGGATHSQRVRRAAESAIRNEADSGGGSGIGGNR